MKARIAILALGSLNHRMIKILSQDLINKIAAGEVVERPASVVKELTENAIDAGSSRIDIVLEEGGIKLIQITDNGSGMSEADAKLALIRHATSKISSAEDLFNIHTLGFRGEALASIAAVSQFSLTTKEEGSPHGSKVFLGPSLQPTVEATSANKGTTVTIKNLFYNVPARQKFLKTPATEFTHILRYLQQFALAHPELEISLEHQHKKVFHFFPADLSTRVQNVLGNEFSSKMLKIAAQQEGLKIEGYIAKPELIHATHKNQYLFVNDRPVYDHLISRAVLEAYDTLIPRGYFPAFVIILQIDPQKVDVNVHPRKSEVKFLQPSSIIGPLSQSIRSKLNDSDLTQEKSFSSFVQFPKASVPHQSTEGTWRSSIAYSRQPKQTLSFSQEFSQGISTLKKSPLEEKGWNILGQIHHSFILVESPEGLQMLDQHAVSEIVNYQRLMTERDQGVISSQGLLLPISLEVSHEEKAVLIENKDLLLRLGWEMDELSQNSIQVNAIPEILRVEKIMEIARGLLDLLKDERQLERSQRELELLKYEACRSAVMFGDALTIQEVKGLLNQWLETPNNAACEHGRPAAAKITVEEMRRYFRR